MPIPPSNLKVASTRLFHLILSASITAVVGWSQPAVAAAPPIPISQTPLTVTIPAHPQIVLAVANSQSMDGNLSGAIMTGSGALAATYSGLYTSSSPSNYTIPTGFTPPLNAGSSGVAPYTVASGGNLGDNSPSRLNVAKGGINTILQSYILSADFALLDYKVTGVSKYSTWVYQMSAPGGFAFTANPGTSRYVANPCYHVSATPANTVASNCSTLSAYYPSQDIGNKPYMLIGSSSDDPSINDVLYDTGNYAVCIAYGAVNPANPFPPNFTLANYNNGGILETYPNQKNACPTQTGPTNAGFVPYSAEVMYEYRGFGFYGSNESANTANILVPMTSSGATPTMTSVTNALAQFSPFLAPETSNTNTGEIKAAGLQSPIAGLLSGSNAYFATNPAPTVTGCSVQRYVILVTDGLPTMDLNGHAWPPLGSASATGYGVTATFNPDGTLATTNDQALTDVIAQLAALKNAGITTYVIGLGAGVDPTKNPVAAQTLTAMAIAGGSGSYFAAKDPATLANNLQSILGNILIATQSVASVAVNSTGLNTNTVVYQAQFTSSDTYQDWTGNLFAFPVNPTTGYVDTLPAHAQWSGQTQLDAQNFDSGRLIATWDPVTNSGTPFRWNTSTIATTGIASSTSLGQALMTFPPDTNGLDAVQYLRGSSAKEVRNGGQFRNRAHKLGDIVFSNPVFVGAPTGLNFSSSYIAFAASHATRPGTLYVGSDDGMLHAFDATTGNERFAFMPKGVYGNLINLVSPFYNAQHKFFVDGSPVSADVQFADSSWHTVLLGTEGGGGNDVFALDVTDPATLTSESALASAALWDFTDPDMGNTYGTPYIANTAAGNLVFVANGYNSPQGKPFLYALNPQTGALIAKVDLCAAVSTACNLSMANGLSSPNPVNSGGLAGGAANLVYAGDLQGNLWRISISSLTPSLWTVSVLAQARDTSGTAQPITSVPLVTLNPRYPQLAGTMVLFATGELLGTPDLSNAQLQTIYGVYDPASSYSSPVTRSSGGLVQQVLTAATIGATQVSVITGNTVSIPASKGWYVDLSLNSGERVATDPRLRNGALIVGSYKPSGNSCGGQDSSYLYVLNYATGGSFASPQFDANNDNTVNQGDMVTLSSGSKVAPAGERLGSGYFSDATFITQADSGGGGCGGNYAIVCGESGACKSILVCGSLKHRTAWWEIRQ